MSRFSQIAAQSIDLPWTEAMLSWQAGPHPEDGVWGAVWYDAVNRSNGFGGPEGPGPELDGPLADLATRLRPDYEAIAAHRLVLSGR